MSKRAIREARRMFAVPGMAIDAGLSPGAKRNAKNRALLAVGIHPATRRPLYQGTGVEQCGNCVHHHAYANYRPGKTFHKCDRHRLGESHSEASDIRVGWPGCELWEEA